MSAEHGIALRGDAALQPLPPGELIRLACGSLEVDIAAQAGGRIAQIRRASVDWLVGHDAANAATIAWGSYPMLPWAGRIRRGRFRFDGHDYELPPNLGEHAIHGVGFALPWKVDMHTRDRTTLSLTLPEDARWPFGGHATQHFELGPDHLRMQLSLTAAGRAMPAAIGWHPWWRKPDRLDFQPSRMYARDAEGIAVLPPATPAPGPWDDCFVNERPVLLQRGESTLRLTSDCRCWVVYDVPAHATCIEPQTAPPDAFNLQLLRLEPRESITAWFLLEWR